MKKCNYCGGSGKVRCTRCGGTGKFIGGGTCPTCKGTNGGRMECPICKGKGEVDD